MQISAFEPQPTTYIVDVLKLTREQIRRTIGIQLLNNPKIIKLMHACLGSDLVWIQKEYGVQCQQVFDT